jgi:hypothetical protein
LIRLRLRQSAGQGQARHIEAATNRTGVFRLVSIVQVQRQTRLQFHVALRQSAGFPARC